MTTSLAKKTYTQALKEISRLYVSAGKALVNMHWQIGRRIVTVEQNGEVRAEYGAGLLQRFSDDLTAKHGRGFSLTNIKHMRQFYLNNQKRQSTGELSWTKIVELLPINDKRKRQHLENLAKRKNITVREIKEKVKKTSVRAGSKPALTTPIQPPKQLQLNTYTLVKEPLLTTPKGMIRVDCGFFVMLNVDKKTATVKKSAHTYSAVIERVVDGDTLKVFIDIGFGIVVNERLRLRGIDTPELSTPYGKKAKLFVQKLLKPGQTIVIKTSKTDLYGRFVADILYLPGSNDADNIISEGVYLNNQLLEEGMAVNL